MHPVHESSSNTNVVTRYALIALITLLPLFFIPLPWSSVTQSKMILVMGLVLLAVLGHLIARALHGSVHVPRSVLVGAVFLLPIAYLVSAAVSGFSMQALIGQGIEQDTVAAVFLWYMLSVVAAFSLAGNPGLMRSLLRAFVLSTLVLFVFQTLHIMFPQLTLGGLLQGPTVNVFGSWHDLGILAGMVVFVTAALWNSVLFNGVWRYVAVAAGTAALLMLFLIHYADVFWGLAALSVLAFVVSVRSALKSEETMLKKALVRHSPWGALAIVSVLAALFAAQFSTVLPDRVAITEVEVRPSWQGTFDVGRQTLSAPSSLVFGSGPNSFIREWAEHKPAGVNATPFWESDFSFGVGIIPTSLFTAGLFGAIAWVAILLAFLMLCMRFVREARPLVTGRMLFGTLLGATGFLLAFQLMYTPGAALTTLTFLFLGSVAAVSVGDAPSIHARLGFGNLRELATIVGMILVAALILVSVGFMGREVASNLLVNRAAVGFQRTGDIGAAATSIGRALLISPNNDRAHRAAAELGVVQLMRLMNEVDTQNADAAQRLQQTLQTTIQHGLTAVSIDDSNYQNWLLLAQVYGNLAGASVQGALEAASQAYMRAFETNPSNPTPKLRLAQLAAARDDRASARTLANEALALKPDLAAAHYLLSQIEAADGNADAALTAAAAAAQYVPQEPLAWFNLGYLLYATGSYREAALSLQQAVTLNPEYANALFILGLSYEALDMPQDAITALQRVRELNPTDTWLSSMIENIHSGKEPYTGIQR